MLGTLNWFGTKAMFRLAVTEIFLHLKGQAVALVLVPHRWHAQMRVMFLSKGNHMCTHQK